MRRLGGAGQFERACTLRLGGGGGVITSGLGDGGGVITSGLGDGGGAPRLYEPPRRFDARPLEEASCT